MTLDHEDLAKIIEQAKAEERKKIFAEIEKISPDHTSQIEGKEMILISKEELKKVLEK